MGRPSNSLAASDPSYGGQGEWGRCAEGLSAFPILDSETFILKHLLFLDVPRLPVGVFLRVFPQKSAELFHTSSVPEMAAGRRAGSVHRCPDTCPEGAVCWPCRPLRRKREQFWVQ